MTNQEAKEMFSMSPVTETPQVVAARPESLGGYIDAFGGVSLMAVLVLLVVAVVAYRVGRRMAPSEPQPNVLVTTNWWAIFKLWSVQGGVLIAAVSGWYASFEAAQELISPKTFAAFIAGANLAVIVLRNLNQKSEVPEGVVQKPKEPPPDTADHASPLLCPNCKAPQEPGVSFCNKCGVPQPKET